LSKLFHNPNLQTNVSFVLLEAAFIGILNTIDPFLPVFLTRLGATTFQVSLITSMPAVAGLFLTIPAGQFLMNSPNILDWYRFPRLAFGVAYFLVAITPFFFHSQKVSVLVILAVLGIATFPTVIFMITFSIVMNAVAGPRGRYELMARRLTIIVLTSAACMAFGGWFLEQVPFPLNYQYLFLILSVIGGAAVFYFASRIKLPDNSKPRTRKVPIMETLRGYQKILKENPTFSSFVWIRFVFILGLSTAIPLIPIYYVKEAQASDAWIGAINTVQLIIMVFGYTYWMRKARGSMPNHTILLWTTLILGLYPALIASTHQLFLIILIAGLAYFFQAGLDLVFFDELMRLVPPEDSIQYVSLAQSVQYIGMIGGPILGSIVASWLGLAGALYVAAGIRLLAFFLFFFHPESASDDRQENGREQTQMVG
jgi:MFS family permease